MTDFSFAVAGDNRNDLGVFPAILQKIDSDPEISFMIHTGDAVMTPRKVFFHELVNTLRDQIHKPFLMVPGNHDIQGRFWATPERSMYAEIFGPAHYTFCLGDLRFILLDSNHLRSRPEDEKEWLRKSISASPHHPVLVFMHVPLADPRGKAFHHSLNTVLYRSLMDIFNASDVKHCYCGHIHGYWSGDTDGIPFTITGGAGAWLYSRDPAHGFYHYVKVKVKDGQITQEVITVDKALLSGLSSYLYYSGLTGTEVLLIILFAVSCGLCLNKRRECMYNLLSRIWK